VYSFGIPLLLNVSKNTHFVSSTCNQDDKGIKLPSIGELNLTSRGASPLLQIIFKLQLL
jgi:hypothetical protein